MAAQMKGEDANNLRRRLNKNPSPEQPDAFRAEMEKLSAGMQKSLDAYEKAEEGLDGVPMILPLPQPKLPEWLGTGMKYEGLDDALMELMEKDPNELDPESR